MCVCFDTQRISMILGINENKYFQSCHTSCDNTCAGFESARRGMGKAPSLGGANHNAPELKLSCHCDTINCYFEMINCLSRYHFLAGRLPPHKINCSLFNHFFNLIRDDTSLISRDNDDDSTIRDDTHNTVRDDTHNTIKRRYT
jgi:hypothetical protein